MSSSHVHVGNPCAVCALYDAFTALSKASTNTEVDAASAPSCWRITPTDFYPYINYFREAEMNDTYEVLSIIFDCLHRSFTPCSGWDCVDCACIAHTVFAMKIFEEVKCWRCSVESKQQCTSFFHQISASDLRTMKINNNDCSFDELIKLVEMNRQLACDPMADGCRELNHVHRSLKKTLLLGWLSTCESADNVSATLKALTTEIDIGVLYHGLEPGNKHYLVSMVCSDNPEN
ncbi:hypothetical protein BVC80_9037g12 [Macleaya cordata]|uniref:Uncharacterized protein n=1 Tax=Macleaya cordata TaxID=56857 RepID=A0A200Q5L1_MACCD|nr:hypothetical protein BVC80_9037g12 [Macleaya cordata]